MTFKKGYIEVCLTTEDGIQHLRCHGWLKRQQILVKSEQVFRKGSEDFGMFIIVIPSEELYEIMDLKDDMNDFMTVEEKINDLDVLIEFFEQKERYEDCGYLLQIKDKIIANAEFKLK